jgi:hypothetical protein
MRDGAHRQGRNEPAPGSLVGQTTPDRRRIAIRWRGIMADRSDNKGFIYFVLGALVVGVGVLAYFLWAEENEDPGMSISVTEDGVSVEGEGN